MKDFIDQFKPKIGFWQNVKPAIYVTAAVMLFYIFSVTLSPGIITFIPCVLALAIIAMTALARLNDINDDKREARWNLRRLGLLMVFAGCIWEMSAPFTGRPYPEWNDLMLYSGFALSWITTPGMPPWARYITGEFRKDDLTVPGENKQ